VPFDEVPERFAYDEGEGDRLLGYGGKLTAVILVGSASRIELLTNMRKGFDRLYGMGPRPPDS
jgi:hypothetical protein